MSCDTAVLLIAVAARLLTESFPQSCMVLLSTTILISCHLKAGFWKSSQGSFALWPLTAACWASISSTQVTVASELLQCCKDKGTPNSLNFTFSLPALQGDGLSSKWWLQKAVGQSLWSWCYLHRDGQLWCGQLWCSLLKDLGERSANPWPLFDKTVFPTSAILAVMLLTQISSDFPGTCRQLWCSWYTAHILRKLIPAALYMGICMLQI